MEIALEDQKKHISFDHIVLRIICKLWYPVNFFHLSFGTQDKCVDHIASIKKHFHIPEDITPEKLFILLSEHKDSPLLQKISREFTRYVPYRFIRPWYSGQTRSLPDYLVNNRIMELQNTDAPYTINLNLQSINLGEETLKWIIRNYKILEAHTLFELLKYLEINNPNIPNISQKLTRPEKRNLALATNLWKGFIQHYPNKTDVFEKKKLFTISSLSIDHFLPWSFVTHDLLWNLHPVEKTVNSKKNNFLPSLKYLDEFSFLQFSFSQFLIENRRTKDLEGFYILFKCSKDDFAQINDQKFRQLLQKVYLPQIEIASTMGFESNWILN